MTAVHDQDKIDPDLFEAIITAINTIATVGSFALAWKQIRGSREQQRQEIDRFLVKQQLAGIEEQFTLVFKSLREVISLFKSVETREGKYLSSFKIGFGRATYHFTTPEFNYYQGQMQRLNTAFSQVSSSSNSLIQLLGFSRISGEDAINDNLDNINEELNSILFSSLNFDEALMRINALRDEVDSYLRQLENLGNGPA